MPEGKWAQKLRNRVDMNRGTNTPIQAQQDKSTFIVRNLDKAMNTGCIQVYYQPVIRTINGALCGAEALARWIDPEEGFLSPAEFIPVLESHSLIRQFDLHMLSLVCADLRESLQNGGLSVPVSLNFSKQDFQGEDIFEAVDQIVLDHDVPRDLIHIEITESVVASSPEQIKQTIEKFHRYGYQVWMDDFGSQLSSLNMLSEYDFDEIKLDMLFLRSFDARSRELVRSVIQMAKRSGVHTLAEGVETREQYEYLRSIGCEKVQGYYFSRPIPKEALLSYARSSRQEPEERAMHGYYDRIGRLDFITDRTLAIVESDTVNFRILYQNEEFQKVSRDIGEEKIEVSDFLLNAPSSLLRSKFWELQHETERSDGFCQMDYTINGKYFRLRSKLISRYGIYSANQVELQNLTMAENNRQEQLDQIFRTVGERFEAIFLIRPDNLIINVMKGSAQKMGEELSAQRAYDRITLRDRYIAWEDHKAFMEFTQPATVRERLMAARQGYLTRYFRTYTENGAAVWMAHTMQYTPDTDLLIYTVHRTSIENQLLQERIESGYQTEKDGYNMLWPSLMQSDLVNLFWKDRAGHFSGANSRFLKTFGLTSEAEIVGKTNEQMQWFVHDDPHRSDDIAVLSKGETTENRIGKCIIKGVPHTIMLSQTPVYRNGEIDGLLGYFVDLDQLIDDKRRQQGIGNTDIITGLLSPQGMTVVFSEYLEAWSTRREKFAVIQLEFSEVARAYASYGDEAVKKMAQELAEILVSVCGQNSSIARLYAGTFSILRKYKERTELSRLEDQLRQQMQQIHMLAGYPATVNPRITVAYAEDQRGIDPLIGLASGGVISAETRSFEDSILRKSVLAERQKETIARTYGDYLEYTQGLELLRGSDGQTEEKLLALLDFQMQLVHSLTNVYLSMHVINLNTGAFFRIACKDYIHEVLKHFGSAQAAFDKIIEVLVKPEYQQEMADFLRIDTLSERIGDRPMILQDFDGTHLGWCRGHFVPVSRNEDGSVKEALFMTSQIADEKQREEQLEKRYNFRLDDMWVTYENLPSIVYAADMDTYEILYMNRKALTSCKTASMQAVKGRKCYEVIQGKTAPCEFCTNCSLQEGIPYEYEFWNAHFGLMVNIRDQKIVHNGRNIRVEQAQEIQPLQKTEADRQAEYILSVLNESMRMALEEQDADVGLQQLMEYLGKTLHSERAYIFEVLEKEKAWTNSYEWCAEGVSPQKEFLSYVPYDDASHWVKEFNRGSFVQIRNINEIRDTDRVVYDYLAPQNIQSLIVTPIFQHGELQGFIGLDNPPAEIVDIISERIWILGKVVASMLERREMHRRLQTLSYIDQLTQLGNRHGVDRFFAEADQEQSLGIVFCDICCLKYVNDTMGHTIGDLLIVQAAEVLQSHFRKADIYRWGGDELLVLAPGIGERELEERSECLREASIANRTPLAVGAYWCESMPKHWESAVSRADNRMYLHKQRLYGQYNLREILQNNLRLKAEAEWGER